jgi:hypothetical protein
LIADQSGMIMNRKRPSIFDLAGSGAGKSNVGELKGFVGFVGVVRFFYCISSLGRGCYLPHSRRLSLYLPLV